MSLKSCDICWGSFPDGHPGELLPELHTYEWKCAFNEACAAIEPVEFGARAPAAPFAIADVAYVLAKVEGENDGEPWLAVVRLKDGRWVYIEAGCDYTGWD